MAMNPPPWKCRINTLSARAVLLSQQGSLVLDRKRAVIESDSDASAEVPAGGMSSSGSAVLCRTGAEVLEKTGLGTGMRIFLIPLAGSFSNMTPAEYLMKPGSSSMFQIDV